MKINFDKIDLKLIAALDSFLGDVKENSYKGDSTWTSKVKEKIAELGLEKGYQVCAGGCDDRFEREWLFDIVWYVENDNGQLIKIPLIVECEWKKSFSQIKYDFEKLLIGNAEKRLFICQSKPSEMNVIFEKLENAINVFEENIGDKFLIAILDSDSENEFSYRSFMK